jgi:hypothetical protein
MKTRMAVAVLALAGAGLGLMPADAVAQKRDRDKITREEILNSSQKERDLLVVIRGLRPHFVAPPRGVRSMSGGRAAPTVLYVNGNKMGDLNMLKQILATDVFEVRYMDPSKAENEFGIGHSGGAVLVTLVKGIKSGERITPP